MPSGARVEINRVAGRRAWVLHDDTTDLHATWVPSAGMTGASLVDRGEELLWTAEGIDAYAQKRAFMGIPFPIRGPTGRLTFSNRADERRVVLGSCSIPPRRSCCSTTTACRSTVS